jgi:hypothetical protein
MICYMLLFHAGFGLCLHEIAVCCIAHRAHPSVLCASLSAWVIAGMCFLCVSMPGMLLLWCGAMYCMLFCILFSCVSLTGRLTLCSPWLRQKLFTPHFFIHINVEQDISCAYYIGTRFVPMGKRNAFMCLTRFCGFQCLESVD